MPRKPQSVDEGAEFSPEETARRRDEALRRALNTPPQPRKAKQEAGKVGKAKKKAAKPPSK